MDWILQTVTMRIQWMLWLNGAAGAGKSAIARSNRRTVSCKEHPHR